MKRRMSIWLPVLLIPLVVMSCIPQAVPSPAPGAAVTTSAVKPAWQQDWEKTLAAARTEGKVVVLAEFGGGGPKVISEAFKNKYGLEVEFILGRAREVLPKLTAERRAGLYLGDIYLAGLSSLSVIKQPGFLDPVKPELALPEVTDTKNWWNNELFYLDKEGLMLAYIVKAAAAVLVNKDIVKPDEIKSYRDLLDPKWKGKIVVMDPTVGAAGTFFFLVLWEIMGPDFTREMAKQDLAITGDARQQAEWLARGKYPVSGTVSDAALNEFVKAGAPIKVVLPKEGTLITASTGAVSMIKDRPHPNAAKVFVNWLLSREGQTIMTDIFGAPSRRLDVKYEAWDPNFQVQPGFRYINSDNEEWVAKRLELQKVSRDIWNVKK